MDRQNCKCKPKLSVGSLHLSTSLQKPLHSLDMSIQGSLMEGRPVVIGKGVHLSASTEEHIHHPEIACTEIELTYPVSHLTMQQAWETPCTSGYFP